MSLKTTYNLSDDIDKKEGLAAYHNYHVLMRNLSQYWNCPLDKTVAAFCALSPQNDYIGNLRSLVSVIVGINIGTPCNDIVVSTYNHCRMRAYTYLTDRCNFDVADRGLKILSFYHNILRPYDPEPVTIDGHMVAVYNDKDNLKMTEAQITRGKYRVIANEFRETARELGILPNQLQATLWFSRKKRLGIKFDPQFDLFGDENDRWRINVAPEWIKPYGNSDKV